jgi:hypothetical protein
MFIPQRDGLESKDLLRIHVFWDVLVVNSSKRCEETLRIHLQGLRSLKKNPATQRHVPEELNPQQHLCENLNFHRFFILLKSYTYAPNEKKCNLCSFHIGLRKLKQLRHTDVILPPRIMWNSLLIRSNSVNFSSIFFSRTPYLKPKYTAEEYETKDILNPEDWITEDVLLCASASRSTFLSH